MPAKADVQSRVGGGVGPEGANNSYRRRITTRRKRRCRWHRRWQDPVWRAHKLHWHDLFTRRSSRRRQRRWSQGRLRWWRGRGWRKRRRRRRRWDTPFRGFAHGTRGTGTLCTWHVAVPSLNIGTRNDVAKVLGKTARSSYVECVVFVSIPSFLNAASARCVHVAGVRGQRWIGWQRRRGRQNDDRQ